MMFNCNLELCPFSACLTHSAASRLSELTLYLQESSAEHCNKQQTVWTQIRPDHVGPNLDQIVWHSDGIPKLNFWKRKF